MLDPAYLLVVLSELLLLLQALLLFSLLVNLLVPKSPLLLLLGLFDHQVVRGDLIHNALLIEEIDYFAEINLGAVAFKVLKHEGVLDALGLSYDMLFVSPLLLVLFGHESGVYWGLNFAV